MKLWIVLAVVSLAAFVKADGRGPSHSVTWGSRAFRDMHVRREIITEKSKFLRVVTRDFVFSQNPKLARTITQIVITDQVREGLGGYAYLTAGGPQSDFVKIHFKSQRNKGFSFIVDVYAI
ncbi:hypothetical protein KR074_011044 [Drosophila pseudoananassae]|nr:hypothetical protein KR074_011044 [Drosophila pseudoananassae]